MLAPICLFVFNRAEHTRQTVESLLRNKCASKHDLIVFSDAPRSPEDKASVQLVRSYLKTIKGFRTITIYYRDYNFGLAKSIIDGVTDTLKKYEIGRAHV